jgi:hypothetical protein
MVQTKSVERVSEVLGRQIERSSQHVADGRSHTKAGGAQTTQLLGRNAEVNAQNAAYSNVRVGRLVSVLRRPTRGRVSAPVSCTAYPYQVWYPYSKNPTGRPLLNY